MTVIRALAEIVLMVDDIERSLAFYRDTLGLEVFSPPELAAKFLLVGERGNGVPQQIVLSERPPGRSRAATRKSEADVHHIGLEVTPQDFDGLRGRLEADGFEVRSGEHPFMEVEAFYINDPDGNEVEIVTARGGSPA